MKALWQVFVIALISCFPATAWAGAWPQAKGDTQLIVSVEPGHASRAYDAGGNKSLSLSAWRQTDISVYADHGLTDRITVTGKLNFKGYQTATTQFSGLTSVEISARWTVHKGDDFVFAVGAGVEGLGKGRRSDFDTAGKQGTDYSARAYFGKNFKFGNVDAFVNIEGAYLVRQYQANQWRLDTTIGLKPSAKWMFLAQSFAGQTDKQVWGQSKWNNVQLSVVRSFGPGQSTSLQLGIRQTVAGRNVPAVNAVIVSLWKRF